MFCPHRESHNHGHNHGHAVESHLVVFFVVHHSAQEMDENLKTHPIAVIEIASQVSLFCLQLHADDANKRHVSLIYASSPLTTAM